MEFCSKHIGSMPRVLQHNCKNIKSQPDQEKSVLLKCRCCFLQTIWGKSFFCSTSSPPIRGGHKSGAVPAYLDTRHTRGHPPTGHSHTALLHCASQSILELSDTVTVHHSASECREGIVEGKWRWSLLCKTRSASNQLHCVLNVCTMCTVCTCRGKKLDQGVASGLHYISTVLG